jgi:hypothetical protein
LSATPKRSPRRSRKITLGAHESDDRIRILYCL